MSSFVLAPPGAIVRQKKLFWWSNDVGTWMTWRHVDALVRPTEDAAFANILTQVRAVDRFLGEWDTFNENEWDCYFTEREVMLKPRPGGEKADYYSEVAYALRMGRFQAMAILDDVGTKMWLREAHGLPALPAIPMQYLRRARKLERKAA